jgi:DNA-binding NtrC family response regulator
MESTPNPRRRRPSNAAASTEGLPPPTVLFVDDDPHVLQGLAVALRGHLDITVALGADDAFDALATLGPRTIVVTDMCMPGVDGAEFLERLSRLHPDTIRIVLTGHADGEATARALKEGGAFRVLAKPCPKETLLAVLSDAMVLAARRQLDRTLGTTRLPASVESNVRALVGSDEPVIEIDLTEEVETG